MHRNREKTIAKHTGEMAEWSIAAVLKTVELKGSGGLNPSLSAINLDNQGNIKLVHEYVHENVRN